jgi:serine protease Do
MILVRNSLLGKLGILAVASALALLPDLWAAGQAPAGLPELAAKLLPGVVNISTDRRVQSSDPSQPRKRESLGSGFIIDPAGIIVTNNHVIDGAYEIMVKLHDRTALKATLIATSKTADVAVLKVNAGKPLPMVEFGDDEKLRVGDPVVAIGNPLGLGGSVSAGIVSALNRNIQLSPYDDFIQTDAAINHGNSGGPLFNMRGEVIGMNTAIYSGDAGGGSIGIGFSIPARNVKFVVRELRLYGHVRPGWLALQVQDVTQDIADALGLPDLSGAIVTHVEPGGSGEQAGIHSGDVVASVGSRPVGDSRAFRREIAVRPLDSETKVGLWRDGKLQEVSAIVREWTDNTRSSESSAAMAAQTMDHMADAPNLGLQMAVLTDYARGKYNLDPQQQGVLVTGVTWNSVADSRGLVDGDVILSVNDEPVRTPEDVQQYIDSLRQQGQRGILILVSGKEGLRWVAFPLQLNQPQAAPATAITPSSPAATSR